MQSSFLRVEDWAPTHTHINNQYWCELLTIIDEFEHLMEAGSHGVMQRKKKSLTASRK